MEDDDDALLAALITYIKERCATYGPKDRLMIFCRSVAEAENLAQIFGTEAYHAKQAPETNKKTYDRWTTGDIIIQVATSLLGTGLDYAAVRDVIMFHFPYTFFDMKQQFERAGRDGLVVYASTFITKKEKVLYKDVPDRLPLGQQEMEDWGKRDDLCRQIGPSLYFDGTAQVCSMLIEPGIETVLCDVCQANSSRAPPKQPIPMPRCIIPGARAMVRPPARRTEQPTTASHQPVQGRIQRTSAAPAQTYARTSTKM